MSEDGKLSEMFQYFSIKQGLKIMLKFILEPLHSLQFKLVHSDISINNIMFSIVNDCWKLIDFDQTMPIEESLRLSRKAGTTGYIAPESLISGIFTSKSDIWSLGRVVFNVILVSFMNIMEIHQNSISQFEREMYRDIERHVFRMMATKPEDRPNAEEALKIGFEILKIY